MKIVIETDVKRCFIHHTQTEFRAQPDWAYEFPGRTGPDTQPD